MTVVSETITAELLDEDDARLRSPSAAIEHWGHEARAQAATLVRTLTELRSTHGFGRALAAPQIGLMRRLIAVDLGAGPFVLVNPEISWRSDESFALWDDCFSLPGRLVRVRRQRSISLCYRDAEFRPRVWQKLPPALSELLQHELDHLDGILMTERALGGDAVRPASERATLIEATRPVFRLSLARIEAAARSIDPLFVNSPQLVSEPLSEALGCRLTLKVETLNPVRCFKGRGAELFLATLLEHGAVARLACASAGNFGQALAYACRKRGVGLDVFAARGANALKVERMKALGATVHRQGEDFDGAKELARQWATEHGVAFVEDGRDAAIAEGAGSIAVELLARGEAFDDVLLPLGNGALLTGVGRWFKAASPATRVIGIASCGASAMADSWRAGRGAPPVVYPRVDTIADGIAVRVPIAEALADMHDVVDDVWLVSDDDLVRAMRVLHSHVGLVVEPAGAAGVAAVLANAAALRGRQVATVLCGGNVAPAELASLFSGGTAGEQDG